MAGDEVDEEVDEVDEKEEDTSGELGWNEGGEVEDGFPEAVAAAVVAVAAVAAAVAVVVVAVGGRECFNWVETPLFRRRFPSCATAAAGAGIIIITMETAEVVCMTSSVFLEGGGCAPCPSWFFFSMIITFDSLRFFAALCPSLLQYCSLSLSLSLALSFHLRNTVTYRAEFPDTPQLAKERDESKESKESKKERRSSKVRQKKMKERRRMKKEKEMKDEG